MSIIRSAAAFAKDMHAGQTRKYGKFPKPYFTHVAAVAGRVAAWAQHDEVVAAAYLHDVIEDCNCSYDELNSLFGKFVANIVQGLTNPSKGSKAPRAVRKQMDAEHIAEQMLVTQRIKLEDRCHNLEESFEGPIDWVKKYAVETKNLLEHIKPEVDPELHAHIMHLAYVLEEF